MKKLRDEKGITLITLVMTMIILTVLTITITASLDSTTEMKEYEEVKSDILTLSEEVKLYYLKNGKLPVTDKTGYDVTTKGSTYYIPTADRNPNDSGSYYAINLGLLKTQLNRGDNPKEKDVYIVNEKSLTVYYLAGIKLKDTVHYTAVDSFENGSYASDYYSKVKLPIISVVTMESNNKDKTIANIGDTITIKILANYNSSEFKTLPTLQILEKNVDITWTNNIGVATYQITGNESNLQAQSKINFKISDYSADGRTGENITAVTFGDGVYFEE